MFGHSITDKEFIKLSHFDRVRRGHYEKIPNILMLLGFTASIHFFQAQITDNIPFISAIVFYCLGFYLKEKFIEQDDKELAEIKKEIEFEFRKRGQKRSKGKNQ